MSQMIVKPLGGQAAIVENTLSILQDADALPEQGPFLVSLKRWQEHRADLLPLAQAGRAGVFLQPEDNPETLEADAKLLPRIGYEFPVFKFGQGYSDAYLLRKRYGFTGELRAFGDIWRDQLFYLARVGFTEFVIKAGKSIEDAILGFNDFTEVYQDSVDVELPLHRRRLLAHAKKDAA